MEAWEKFKKFITKRGLVKEGDNILLSVSGGPDSVCMLHLFWRLSKTVPLGLHVCTFDHGLRKESRKEVKLVQNLSKQFGIPCTAIELPVKDFSRKNKISTETSGRLLRYRYLARIAAELCYNKVATAHTANDNAETFLMWLARGTGAEGLSGIPLERDLVTGIRLIRPILSLTKPEILSYLKRQKLRFYFDKSNLSLDYTRNRIRHTLIPLFEKLNKKFVDHVYNSSKILAIENEYFSEIVERKIKSRVFYSRSLPAGEAERIKLDLKQFFGYNNVLQLRILKRILPEKRSQFNIERLLDWLKSRSVARIHFSNRWDILRKKGQLIFSKRNK
jgi:tRNA(Ile)-lysidine synthase